MVGGLAWACLALLALASGVTCLCWQLVRFALLEWAFALDFSLQVKLGHSGCSLVLVLSDLSFFSVDFFFENALRVLRR